MADGIGRTILGNEIVVRWAGSGGGEEVSTSKGPLPVYLLTVIVAGSYPWPTPMACPGESPWSGFPDP